MDQERSVLLKKAGVTHLEFQCYPNPANNPGISTIELFEKTLKEHLQPRITRMYEYGLKAIARLDDRWRTEKERLFEETEWSYRADQAVANYLDNPVIDRVEMVDESQPPSVIKPWRFLSAWKPLNNKPIGWPSISPSMWDTDELSSYASCMWPAWSVQDLPLKRVWQMMKASLAQARKDRPKIAMIHCFDKVTPSQVVAQIYLALALGASGFRAWKTGPGHAMWEGISRTYGDLANAEFLYSQGTPFEFTESDNFVCGRRGNHGWIVNISNQKRKHPFQMGQLDPAQVGFFSAD